MPDPNFDPAYMDTKKDLAVDSNDQIVSHYYSKTWPVGLANVAPGQRVIGTVTTAGAFTFALRDGGVMTLNLPVGLFSERLAVVSVGVGGGGAGSFYNAA